MSKPIIEIQGIGKRYRIGAAREPYLSLRDQLAKRVSPAARRARVAEQEFWALKDIDFSVEAGEAVGIIGRNGAGKSTLLKILSQITPPTTGKISMRGRVGSLLEVGTGFHPELTGRENIYMNGSILGMRRKEISRKFDEIVAFAEMEKFLDTPVKRYSSGMYVRLAFAVAAHLEPEILVVDEVLAVGDTGFQRKCLGKMGEVARGGRTVLFVSHNMATVKALCRRAILLNAGRLAFQGSTDDGIEAYIGGGCNGDPIVSHVERSDPRIELHAISINGTTRDVIEIAPGVDLLEIVVEGFLKEPLPTVLEMRISDSQGVPLALFSPGHRSAEIGRVPAGPFSLRYRVRLPRMMKGAYQANLYLTEPLKHGWVDIPGAAKLTVCGEAIAGGRVMEYSAGAGFIMLESVAE